MEKWLEKHPRINAFLNALSDGLHYMFTGGWIVDLVRWMIDAGGNIAESAFILATVYVTLNTVAHLLISWLLPDNVITALNQFSIIAFSVLPELIVVAAMAICFDHWRLVVATKRIDCWIWAIAYSIPTVVFLGMTIYTITSFVSFEVANTMTVHHMVNGKLVSEVVQVGSYTATGPMLVTRCLAGWCFGTVQMLFVKLGKPGYTAMIDNLNSDLESLGEKVSDRDTQVTSLQDQVTTLQQQVETQSRDLVDARLAIATQKVTRTKSDQGDSENDLGGESAHNNGKVTNLGASAQRAKLKKHIRKLVLAGTKINYKQITADTGISYNTVRRHADAIIKELTSEHSSGVDTEQLEAQA